MLADPAVFSSPLEATVRAELEVSGPLRDTLTQGENGVFRALQTEIERVKVPRWLLKFAVKIYYNYDPQSLTFHLASPRGFNLLF